MGTQLGSPQAGVTSGQATQQVRGPWHRAPAISRRPAVGQRTTACPGDGRRGLWCLVPSLPHARGAALCSRLLAAGPAVPVRSGASGLLTGLTSCVPSRCVAVAGSCRAEFRWSRALSPPPPHTGCAWTGRKARGGTCFGQRPVVSCLGPTGRPRVHGRGRSRSAAVRAEALGHRTVSRHMTGYRVILERRL